MFQLLNGNWMPMIGADLERVEELTPLADYISKKDKLSYEIRYFKSVLEL